MKPTVIANGASAGAATAPTGNGNIGTGINIPISHEYGSTVGHGSPHQQQRYHHQHQQHAPSPQQQQQYYQQQQQPFVEGYGSPRQHQMPSHPPPQQQQHHQPQHQQHFQPSFGFEPDMEMDMDNMFPRSRLGRLHGHDPFAGFGSPHFGFPQFSTMGRRGRAAGSANDDDFFNRLPSEFRQYIPDGFGTRRTNSGGAPPAPPPQQQHHQHPDPRYTPVQKPQQPPEAFYQPNYQQQQPQQQHQQEPQSPSKRLCDAAIQTEDLSGRSEVDCAPAASRNDNLNQHGLRNTMDMGVKSAAEQEQAARSHSAPPPEQQQQNLQYQQQQQQQQRASGGTQTTPKVQGQYQQEPPQFQKAYYAPQHQAHPQQKEQTPPPTPQTPNGTYIRTIPIFVEGRTEPIINAHKEIPNQNASPGTNAQASAQARTHGPPTQQPHRPSPLNTQQQQFDEQQTQTGLPPQTPHTVDSINKIQDIQRDVLELMGKVEQFKGTRQEKEYVYLDEMLTRNLLKLDTIDTNGKDSIRLARKEAIKCIQASINVLEAKAEENARMAVPVNAPAPQTTEATIQSDVGAESVATPQPNDATKIQEPIPLPAPPGAEDNSVLATSETTEASGETTPAPSSGASNEEASATGTSNQTTVTSEVTKTSQ